jgi:hypothetical protein
MLLASLLKPSHGNAGLSAGLFRCHACLEIVLGEKFEMIGQLFVEVFVKSTLGENGS